MVLPGLFPNGLAWPSLTTLWSQVFYAQSRSEASTCEVHHCFRIECGRYALKPGKSHASVLPSALKILWAAAVACFSIVDLHRSE